MADVQDPIIYNVYWKNDNSTDTNLDLSQSFNLVSPLFPDSENYSLAITKLNLPSSLIESFKTLTPEDYTVGLITPTQHNIGDNEFTCSYPDTNGLVGTDYVGVQKIYSDNDNLQIINSMTCMNYRDYVKSFGANYLLETGNLYLHGNGSANSYSVDSSTFSATTNAPVGLIEIEIQKIVVLEPMSSWSSFSSAKPAAGDYLDEAFSLVLSNPGAATTNVVFAIPGGKYIDFYDGTSKAIFTDAAFESRVYMKDTDHTGLQLLLPTESFFKYHNSNSVNQTWTLTCKTFGGDFKCGIELKMRFYGVPAEYPRLPLSFTVDDKDKLVLEYDKKYAQNGFRLITSPKMHSILNFFNQDNYAAPFYHTMFPPSIITSTTELMSYTQNASTKYLLSNIQRIAVISYGLSVLGELDGQNVNNNVLTDFSVDNENDLGKLTYSQENLFWRYYKLRKFGALTNIDLQVMAIYDDNTPQTSSIIQIPPASSAMLRLTFIKRKY